MYDRILLPTDVHDASHRTIRQATALAAEVGASVHAVAVVNERRYESLDDGRAERDAAGRETLAAVRSAAPGDVRVETSIRYGVPHREILEAAADVGADVIVIGTRRRTGLDRVLVGSTTELVVRRTSIPVLTVDTTDKVAATADDTASPVDRVLDALETAADALAEPYRTRS